jgi:putative phosphoserine phosphatase / 1-acylglycerol-3-phosphate O-acyltransferase
MSRVVAIFDVDQTLVQGYTERLFFRYLVRRRRLGVPRALAYLGRVACRLRDRFQDKSYLEGLPVEEVVRLARQCYREDIAPRVSPAGLACVQEHQAQGHAIALLSGSLSLLLAPLQEELGADWLIATELQRQKDQFTGAIAGLNPRGPNKLRLLQELSRRHGFDLSQAYAYGDHIQDSHLFRSIGHPVAVNPSWRLKLRARKHQWPIRYFTL